MHIHVYCVQSFDANYREMINMDVYFSIYFEFQFDFNLYLKII